MVTPSPTFPSARARARSLAGLAGVVLALTTSCVTTPDETGDLAANRRKWAAQGLRDYTVQSRTICFCVLETTAPVTLTVQGGVLVSVTRVSDGAPVPPDQWSGRYYTVDGLFALIADAQKRGAFQVRVSYDAALGYPTEVYLDESAAVADEERTFELNHLTPIR